MYTELDTLNRATICMNPNADILPYTRIIFQCRDGAVDYFIGTDDDIVYAKGDRVMCSPTVRELVKHIESEDSTELDMLHTPLRLDKILTYLKAWDGVIILYGVITRPDNAVPSHSFTIGNVLYSFCMFEAGVIKNDILQDIYKMSTTELCVWREDVGVDPVSECIAELLCSELKFTFAPDLPQRFKEAYYASSAR